MNKFIVIDVETTGVNPQTASMHGLGIAWEEDSTDYYTLKEIYGSNIEKVLADETVGKIGHNIRFDIKFLLKAGLKVNGPLGDTMLIAKELDVDQPVGLELLAAKYLGPWAIEHKIEIQKYCSKYQCKHIGEICKDDLIHPNMHAHIIAKYCKADCNITFKLWEVLKKKFVELDSKIKNALPSVVKGPIEYYTEEVIPLEKVLLKLELSGIKIDLEVFKRYSAELSKEQGELIFKLRRDCLEHITKMEDELYRIALSKRVSEKGKAKVKKSSDSYKTKFNWQSSAHIGELLYEHLGLQHFSTDKTKTGKWNTAEKHLSNIRNLVPAKTKLGEILNLYAQYKKVLKKITTYVSTSSGYYPKSDGKIYPRYLQGGFGKDDSQGGTATGRLSSSQPNLQNLPRQGLVKSMFIPSDKDNVFVVLDYSQLELRIAAHLSNDDKLIESFNKGIDLHAQTTQQILNIVDLTPEQRAIGKTLNFALIYGASAWKLYKEFFEKLNYNIDEVSNFRESFFKLYPGYEKYLRLQLQFMLKYLSVISYYGRLRRLPDLRYYSGLNKKSKKYFLPIDPVQRKIQLEDLAPETVILPDNLENTFEHRLYWAAYKRARHAENVGYNHPIQSFGASLTKRSMLAIHKKCYKIVTQVHDSIVVEISRKDLTKVQDLVNIMESVEKLKVPLKVDVKIRESLGE